MRKIHLIYSLLFLFTACLQPEQPVTPDEAKTFAQKLQQDMAKRNPTSFDAAFDFESLKDRMKIYCGKRASRKLIAGTAEGLRKAGMGTQITRALGEKGSYKLVKQYEKDGKQHLVFRLYTNQTLNYHDLELVKRMGRVKIADVLIYLSGENFSATMGETAIMMNDNYDDFSKEEQEKVLSIKKIRQMLNNRQYQEANTIYQSLPAILRQQKLFMLVNLEITAGLDQEAYIEAMDAYIKAFPNAPNIPLVLIDRHFLAKEYDKALEDVNDLDAMINKDPFLDYYRALIAKMQEDKKRQGEFLEKVYGNMPDIGDVAAEMLVFYMEEGEEDKALAIYKDQKKRNGFTSDVWNGIDALYPSLKEKI